jgi:hypothetical protein
MTLAVLAAVVASCGKKSSEETLAPAASALTASSASTTSGTWHFTIEPKGSTQVDMPGLKEHIKGEATGAAGSLDVVASDLAQSRGLVRIDLATFSTHTFGDPEKDATQTKHARTWLEAVVDDKTDESMRWADFAIRSIDGASATELTKIDARNDGADDVRTVTLTVHGDVLIHGHRVQKDAVVTADFRYPAGAAADSRPARVEIKTKEPMHVVLKELDVRPRDPAGQLLDWTAKLISKVAETADVTVDLGATPAPAAQGQ